MGLKLVIAEKPSVCNDIARVIGATDKKKGFLIGNGYIVTHCVGHLVELAEPEAYGYEGKWKEHFDALPFFPDRYKTVVKPEVKAQFELIKTLMNDNRVDEIIVATDAGREGQYIYGLVAEKAGCHKPEKRLWISSMTDTAIKDGMAHLRDNKEYKNLYENASCRAKADWEVGINFTRLYTVLYDVLLSVGRVQTPVLNMIVRRHEEILAFKPVPFYEVEVNAEGLPAKWYKGDISRFESQLEAAQITKKVMDKQAVIEKLETKERTTDRPKLYSLNELQKDANKRFGYTSGDVLKSAQKLYETYKVTTYPRTDSQYLTDDMESLLADRLKEIGTLETYKTYADTILQRGLNIDKNIINNEKVSDHHAIIPTERIKGFDVSQLDKRDKDILHLIVTRFLVSLSPKMIYDETQAVLKAEGETFKSGCKIVKDAGFMAVQKALLKGKGETDSEEGVHGEQLLHLKQGDTLLIKKAVVLSKKTTAPKEYTDASIITAMEHPGSKVDDEEIKEKIKGYELGTTATRAGIIDTLIARKFVVREKSSLIPTQLGIELIHILPDVLKSPEMTAEWEKKLAGIGEGVYSSETFMREIKTFVTDLTKAVKESDIDTSKIQGAKKETNAAPVLGKCPCCGGDVVQRKTKEKNIFYGCNNYKNGCKFSLSQEHPFIMKVTGKKLTDANVKSLLSKGKYKGKVLKKDGNGTYDAYLVMKAEGNQIKWSTEFIKTTK